LIPFNFLSRRAREAGNPAGGQKGRGGWVEGIFARLPKKRSPTALLIRSRTPQKSYNPLWIKK